MLIGYGRVSTADQNLALQRDVLTEAGCERIFTERVSGAAIERPALREVMLSAAEGDTLVWCRTRPHGDDTNAAVRFNLRRLLAWLAAIWRVFIAAFPAEAEPQIICNPA